MTTISSLPSVKSIPLPALASAAQKVYDEWDADSDPDNGDPEVGFGGICQDIAGAMCDVLASHGVDCTSVSQQIDDQHVYVVAKFREGVYLVDIPPHDYERGGGYNWTKIKGVRFTPHHIVVHQLDADPETFDQYTEESMSPITAKDVLTAVEGLDAPSSGSYRLLGGAGRAVGLNKGSVYVLTIDTTKMPATGKEHIDVYVKGHEGEDGILYQDRDEFDRDWREI
jgi:hypothetical protein